MTAVVFLGPTLATSEAKEILPASYFPPVSQGDVLRAVQLRPRVIAIIDGYFERVPAVWHKEILWAMSQGTHVYGAASMGALRAAELGAFGMVGVGQVFQSFQSGEIESDDEVAVAHAPADDGYRAVSEALVNIRATLRAAEREGVILQATREQLERIAQALFYPERTYRAVLALGRRHGLPESEAQAFSAFTETARVDQKRLDAIDLLGEVRAFLDSDPPPKTIGFAFEHTDAWETASRHVRSTPQS